MSGFLPRGLYRLAEIRDAMGVESIGGLLASGQLIASVRDFDGQFLDLLATVWIEQEDASDYVAAGALPARDGAGPFPLYVRSLDPDVLIRAVELKRRSVLEPQRAAPPKSRAGGRPQKWDWEGAVIELARLDSTEGTQNKTQADVVRHLQAWFVDQTGDSPAESELKLRVGRFMRSIASEPET